MASDEEVARGLLRAAAPEHPGVSADAVVREGLRRRRRLNLMAMIGAPIATAGTVGVVLLGAKWIGPGEANGPVATESPTRTASTSALIPWIDAPAQEYVAVGNAQACEVEDLSTSWDQIRGAGVPLGPMLVIANDGLGQCWLPVRVGLVAVEPGLPDVRAGIASQTGHEGFGLLIPRGGSAAVVLDFVRDCGLDADTPDKAPSYGQVRLEVRPGAGLEIDGPPGGIVPCSFTVSRLAGDETSPLATDPLSAVQVTVLAVGDLVPGSDYTYAVRLENPTGRDIVLDRCPSYLEEVVDVTGASAAASWLLNCGAAPLIPAGSALEFEMRIAMPESFVTGPATLAWSLIGPGMMIAESSVSVGPSGTRTEEALPRTVDKLPVGASTLFLYRAHCGVEWLAVGTELWRTDLRDDGSHNPPPGWPEMIAGTLTRTATARITFTSDEIPEVLVFEPAPESADPGECN